MLITHPNVDLNRIDQRVQVLLGWDAFEAFLAARGDRSGNRITYLDGTLEIMSPSEDHEFIKKNLARLLEAWALESDLEIIGYGSWTLKQKRKKSGIEPDECYFIGPRAGRQVPDLALEVIWTSGGLEKLEVYHRLGVREVWVWESGQLQVFRRRRSQYVRRRTSELLPNLDLHLLAKHARSTNQHRAIKAFLAASRRH